MERFVPGVKNKMFLDGRIFPVVVIMVAFQLFIKFRSHWCRAGHAENPID